ncbi:MAG TPA: cysteine peptidase family C39 domain-containing protein [Kofleriaceae bacterium]|jgi:ABC-type bacteriocin/lantibiotic exporter with double-glycine peptidase domain
MRRLLVLIAVASLGACRLAYTGGAHPVAPTAVDSAGWLRAQSTPIVLQHADTDCGVAALAMVAGAWGKPWTVDDIGRTLVPTEKGVKLGAIRDYARAHGLEAYAIRGTREDLTRELAAGRPVLLGLLLPFDMKHNRSHYEVAIGLNPKDGTVVTLDPATGKHMARSPKVLDVEWKPADYATLVVTGPQPVARN